MTTTSNHVTSPAKTGKSLSLDEYKNLTGDRQLQQMIQSAVTSALGQMYLDNPIPDHSDTKKSTMSTIDAKMKRCCISTEFGNIWVQGKTIPQMCQAFHEKMRMLEGVSSDSQEEGANPLFEDYAQEWWDTYEAKRLSGGTKIDYDMNLHKHVIPYFKGKRLKDITTKDVQGFYDERAEYANSTCRHWRTLLYGIFNSAIEDNLLTKNPAKSVRLTMSKKKTERLPISKEEAAALEANLHLLEGKDLLPFAAGIQAGCGAVMVGHVIVEAMDGSLPASLSPAVHEYLRDTMGFTGVIMTDDLVMQAITDQYGAGEAAVMAVLAGNDLLCSTEYATQYQAVLQAVLDGRISVDTLNAAVRHVLVWKQQVASYG